MPPILTIIIILASLIIKSRASKPNYLGIFYALTKAEHYPRIKSYNGFYITLDELLATGKGAPLYFKAPLKLKIIKMKKHTPPLGHSPPSTITKFLLNEKLRKTITTNYLLP